MRSVLAGLGITLDGVVESPGSWMLMDAEMGELISAGIARADAILLGPRTYLDMARIWPTQGSEVPMADFMNNTPKYVLSSTLGSANWGDTTILRGSLIDEVTALKNRPGRHIQVPGSPRLVRSLLQAGLLDELSLMINPVVLGSGLRLFDDLTGRIDLALTDSTTLRSGAIVATYRAAP